MGSVPRFRRFLERADAALLSAIEIYNKPDFAYREEAFALLALNAWELLLKGRVLKDNENDIKSLYVYERRRTKSGKWAKRMFIKRNRTGNPYTKSLFKVVQDLDADPDRRLPPAVRKNLMALTEIRDNAAHFIHPGPELAKQVLEIGTAAVKNYVELATSWFQRDFTKYKLYLMPIGFVSAPGRATAVQISASEDNLVTYLRNLVAADGLEDSSKGFHVALDVNIAAKRSSERGVAIQYQVTRDPSAPALRVEEENIRRTFPWDYRELTDRLKGRYTDFVQNKRYHDIRKSLRSDERYVRTRLLDPNNPMGVKREFYNPNIVAEFDKHYTRR